MKSCFRVAATIGSVTWNCGKKDKRRSEALKCEVGLLLRIAWRDRIRNNGVLESVK